MKAVGYYDNTLPITDVNALIDIEIPAPSAPTGRDLLVRVEAVSVNPRDIKSRKVFKATAEAPMVLGYDACGTVEAAGPDAKFFKPGDRVFYAGVLDRQGSNAEFQRVDERIVGKAPATLSPAEAAALPLTALTAFEMLFDRLAITEGAGEGAAILVNGGAGGVPSIAIQLARALTKLTVIATASRPESEAWVRDLGAHHVVNHRKPLKAEVDALGLDVPVAYIFSTHTDTASWAEMAGIVAAQGKIGLIDDPEPLDLKLVKFKSVSIHWEAMFTRPMAKTHDIERQHEILNRVADLVDAGRIRATATETLGAINAANLRKAHALLEADRVVGKLVLAGFEEPIMTDKAIAASDLILGHWQAGTYFDTLPEAIRPNDRAEAYRAQAHVERLTKHRLFGWKIAATSIAGQKHINVSGPLAGRIIAEKVFTEDAVVPLGTNRMLVAEAEFAFRMAETLRPRAEPYNEAEVMAAVETLFLAIEVPNSRFVDFCAVGEAQLIADNACADQFVLGPEVPPEWRDLDLSRHAVTGTVAGKTVHEGTGANVLGDPRIALTWIANELSRYGVPLKAGEIVTTGTCVVPLPIAAGDTVTADYGTLGTITVRFSA